MTTRKTAKINAESLKVLEKHISNPGNPKFFFTMTEINKVGINPQSGYATPLGVFCYPLTPEYYERLVRGTLPFAGTKPYVTLFTMSSPTFNMGNYTESDLARDSMRMERLFGGWYEKRNKKLLEREKYKEALQKHIEYVKDPNTSYDECLAEVKKVTDLYGSNVGVFFIEQIAKDPKLLANKKQEADALKSKPLTPDDIDIVLPSGNDDDIPFADDGATDIAFAMDGEVLGEGFEAIKEKAFNSARTGTPIMKMWNLSRILSGTGKQWNVLLRQLGYTNFYDPGKGWIHPHEPAQMVVLDPSVIIIVETFYNHKGESDFKHLSRQDTNIIRQRNEQTDNLISRVEYIENPKIIDRIARSTTFNTDVFRNIISNDNVLPETIAWIYYTYLLGKEDLNSGLIERTFSTSKTPSQVKIDIVLSGAFVDLEYLSAEEMTELYERQGSKTKRTIVNQIIANTSDTSLLHRILIDSLGTQHQTLVMERLIDKENLSRKTIEVIMKTIIGDESTSGQRLKNNMATSNHPNSIELQMLANDGALISNIIENPNATGKMLDRFVSNSKEYNPQVSNIARSRKVSNKTLNKIFQIINSSDMDESRKNRAFVNIIRNSNTSSELLSNILDEGFLEPSNAVNIVRHQNASPEIIDKTVRQYPEYYEVQLNASSRPNISAKTLDRIASETKEAEILRRVCFNRNVSEATINKVIIENDEPYFIRSIIMDNENISQDTLNRVYWKYSNNATVLNAIIDSPVVPEYILRDILNKEFPANIGTKAENRLREITQSKAASPLSNSLIQNRKKILESLRA